MNTWRRMGSFFVGLGLFLLILFVVSDYTRQAEFGLLGWGFVSLVAGIFILTTHPQPAPPPSPRFRVLKQRKGGPQPQKQPPAKPADGAGSKPAPAPAGGGAKPGAPPAGGGKPGAPPAGGGGKPAAAPAGKPPPKKWRLFGRR